MAEQNHCWSGYPGAFCVHCGISDLSELAIARGFLDPYTDEWVSEAARLEYQIPPCRPTTNPTTNGETCDQCDAPLKGSLIVTTGVIGTTGVISLTGHNRNWILCDGCNALVCHTCAPAYKTGYCPDCIREYGLKFDEHGRLIDSDDYLDLDQQYEEAVRRDR